MFVNVHGYDTLPVDQCRFESHKRFVDLHYCIRGGERIAWALSTQLIPDGTYNQEQDFQFHKPAAALATLTLTPGYFAIFHPEEAHRPKEYDEINQSVWKLVVKVRCDLLDRASPS